MQGRLLARCSHAVQQRGARWLALGLALLCLLCIDEALKLLTGRQAAAAESGRLRLHLRLPKALQVSMSTPAVSPPLHQSAAANYTPQQVAAITQPAYVAMVTPHFFGDDYERVVHGCAMDGLPLSCGFFGQNAANEKYFFDIVSHAEAIWYHAPHTCGMQGGPWWHGENLTHSPFKMRADQLAVIMSMESAAYYGCLNDADFMAKFDVEMTYRRTSAVPMTYYNNGFRDSWERSPPLDFDEKRDAVAFINSNCAAASARTQILEQLMAQPGIRVDSWGGCLNNMGNTTAPRDVDKIATLRKYRYCIAIENSVAVDYVSEKVYDALVAGCLPIYLGAPNFQDFIPHPDAVIDLQRLGSVPALAQELQRLSGSRSAYEERFAWRGREETWTPAFRELMQSPNPSCGVHSQCELCQVMARKRAGLEIPKIPRYTPPCPPGGCPGNRTAAETAEELRRTREEILRHRTERYRLHLSLHNINRTEGIVQEG